jgi:hypothetical protein
MSEPSWLVLFKFGERTYLEEFRNGILHMNPQRYFSKRENDCVRTDRFEGSTKYINQRMSSPSVSPITLQEEKQSSELKVWQGH